jgi:hypothetical protein
MQFLPNHGQLLQAILASSQEEDDEDDINGEREEFFDREEAKWAAQENLPEGAFVVATFENEVENWTTWTSEKTFYVCKIPDKNNAYLLFQLDWDDNWESWQFYSCAAVVEAPNKEAATKQLLREFALSSIQNSGGGEWEAFLRSLLV